MISNNVSPSRKAITFTYTSPIQPQTLKSTDDIYKEALQK